MPPKKAEVSKKAEQKKREKIVEDKTFGLKNKKGAKNQKFIQQVQKQTLGAKKEPPKPSKKEEKRKELEEFNAIFKPVATQKIDKGIDPKSVLCAFFKQGQCSKGDKCKFSHDLSVERKSEKRNIYHDSRSNEDDNMENWDDDKLKQVVEKKHGEKERTLPKTDIICKYFIDALESNKYGWFWECPNGGDKCHYRHALPQGFVLKRDKKKERVEEICIEDIIEQERAKLGGAHVRITLESFLAWKKVKLEEKKKKLKKESEIKHAEYKAGRSIGLSGREMFTFNPDLIAEGQMEEGEATVDSHEREEAPESMPCKEINYEELLSGAKEVDGTGTVAPENRLKETNKAADLNAKSQAGATARSESSNIPIDESLFLDENLHDLDKELESMNL